MRYLLNITLLCSIFLMSSFSSKAVSADDWNPNSGYESFIFHVDVLHGIKADIMIFTFDDEACDWVKTYEKSAVKRLHKRLDPTLNHQVWFTDPATGYTKILYIDAGDSGPWFKPLDLDFNDLSFTTGRMYQDPKNPTDYRLEKVSNTYTNVGDCDHPVGKYLSSERYSL